MPKAVQEFRDPADLPQASAADPPEDHFLEALCPRCAHPVDAVCPACGNHVEPNGVEAENGSTNGNGHGGQTPYRRLILLIQNSRNKGFTLDCLLIATGDSFADGISMTEVAQQWSVKKATVSKHCRLICERLEITPSRYMRSEEVADKFRLSNRRPTKAGL